MRNEKGFTLIELVMVIVILGILTAVAVPKFIDLRTEARTAAIEGVAGAIASASAVNYAARSAGNTTETAATQGQTCQAAANAILEGGVPSDYTLTHSDGTATTVLVSGANSCTVSITDSGTTYTASAVIIGIQ